MTLNILETLSTVFTDLLIQGSQTYGPRAKSGPLGEF